MKGNVYLYELFKQFKTMAYTYKHQENDDTMAAEPVMAYGSDVSLRGNVRVSHPAYDNDMQRAIPIEEFRKQCHEELRRMYGKV